MAEMLLSGPNHSLQIIVANVSFLVGIAGVS